MDQHTVVQLRDIARGLNIPSVYKLRKAELIDAILAAQMGRVSLREPSVAELLSGKAEEKKEKPEIDDLYFLKWANLTDQQKRYCRCIAHVASQQPEWCLRERAWYDNRGGRGCYNPWAVCTKSTGRRGVVECSGNYDFANLPEKELVAYALLFHDQVLAANRWRELPKERHLLEEGLNRWVTTRK